MTWTVGSVRTSSPWSRSAWAAFTLILATVTCLLVLPAAASAKVDKKHAKAYAAKVAMFASLEDSHRDTYNAYSETLAATANAMKPMIGDPDPNVQFSLAQLKSFAKECHESYLTEHRPENRAYLKKVRAFYPTCKGWFRKSADKIRFHKWTKALDMGVHRSNRAFLYLANAFLRLSEEDIAGAQSYNNQANELVKVAGPMIDEALDGLRALRR